MKTTYFRSPSVMMLMFSVLMVIMINASEKPNEEGNGLIKKAPIIMSKFEENRFFYISAIKSLSISSKDIIEMILSFLGLEVFVPSETNEFSWSSKLVKDSQISSDGYFLLLRDSDRKSLHLADLTNNARPVRMFSVGGRGDTLVSYALANNRSLVVGGSYSRFYLWNVFSGYLINVITFESHAAQIFCRFFLQDKRIAIASKFEIKVWEVETDKYECLQSIQVPSNSQINNLVASSNNGLLIYTQMYVSSIHVVDSSTGEELRNVFDLRDNPIWQAFCMSLEQDQLFASIDESHNIDLWNMTTKKRTKTINIADLRDDMDYTIQYFSSKWIVLRGVHNFDSDSGVVVVYDLQNEAHMFLQDGDQILFVKVFNDKDVMVISEYKKSIMGYSIKDQQMKVYSLGTKKSIKKE